MHLRFRELREERKLSQSEMAKILHVSQQTYSRYESHKTEIPLEKLVYLAKFFDTSVNYLLGVEEKKRVFAVMRAIENPTAGEINPAMG